VSDRGCCFTNAGIVAVDPILNAQRLLRLKEVSKMVGLKRSAIYQYVADGRFLLRLKLGLEA
jgi:predicted DNA-binding transcriptional regulator AlpA